MKKLAAALLILFIIVGIIYEVRKKSEAGSPSAIAMTGNQENLKVDPLSHPATTPAAPVASSASSEELTRLTELILDVKQSQESRRQALYSLTQNGPGALNALSRLATTSIPSNLSEYQQAFEAGLRVTAMESLDELAVDPNLSVQVKETMTSVLKTQKHQSLTLLAQISLSGIESGKPGKIKRAIDTLIKEQK